MIDDDRDKSEATDDSRVPEELKELASKYLNLEIEPEAPDIVGDFLARLSRKG